VSGNVDEWKVPTSVAGWAADDLRPDQPIVVEILRDGLVTQSLLANNYRQDLELAGLGNGRHGFHAHLNPQICTGAKVLEVRGKFLQGAATLNNGLHLFVPADQLPKAYQHKLSQQRWQGYESPEHLTWGRIWTGDTFVDFVSSNFQFTPSSRIAEVGPGYGRILKTILDRGLPFKEYVGLELSERRVAELSRTFADSRVRFTCADILTAGPAPDSTDLFLASSTFEHLYPDCLPALKNVYVSLDKNGVAVIDFVEPQGKKTGGTFHENEAGTYVRIYSPEELENLFLMAKLKIIKKSQITLGTGATGEVRRIAVVAAPKL